MDAMVCTLVMQFGMSWEEAGNTTYPQYRMLCEWAKKVERDARR